jgi:hypothetical protein
MGQRKIFPQGLSELRRPEVNYFGLMKCTDIAYSPPNASDSSTSFQVAHAGEIEVGRSIHSVRGVQLFQSLESCGWDARALVFVAYQRSSSSLASLRP